MNILIVAAENDALENGKVGGMGDVIRDIAPALANRGARVIVLTPSHGFLHTHPAARHLDTIGFMFRGSLWTAEIFEVPGKTPHPGVRHLVLHHPELAAPNPITGAFQIYVNDSSDRPFFSDASRFALFGAAAATATAHGLLGELDVVHLHDWHAGVFPILREFEPGLKSLQRIRTVLTLHNIALQGIRPFAGSPSSLEAWFPGLSVNWLDVSDPRWPECINFMAAGIRLCDAVHTVSPSYAREILLPSDPPRYYGGEGLEAVLRHAENRGVLTGILNGVTYDDRAAPPKNLAGMLPVFKEAILQWAGATETVPASLFIARSRIDEISRRADAPDIILCSVGRLVDQKVRLMRETGTAAASALERILKGIGPKGLYFLLGTGTAADEGFFRRISARHENFIFLNGYSNRCAATLYANGDLFLMPSSFEPCGISQMLAMREGQPCVVHAVGGLKDTVIHGVNGFTFSGTTLTQQADHFVSTTLNALALRQADPERWRRICHKASAARFNWDDTARQYMKTLYGADPGPPSGGKAAV